MYKYHEHIITKPVGVFCEIVKADGSLSKVPKHAMRNLPVLHIPTHRNMVFILNSGSPIFNDMRKERNNYHKKYTCRSKGYVPSTGAKQTKGRRGSSKKKIPAAEKKMIKMLEDKMRLCQGEERESLRKMIDGIKAKYPDSST